MDDRRTTIEDWPDATDPVEPETISTRSYTHASLLTETLHWNMADASADLIDATAEVTRAMTRD